MALAYTPPGVSVEELFSPSVSPLLAVSAGICLIGKARGYEVGYQQITVPPGVTPFALAAPTGTTFVKVDSTHAFESVINLLDPTAGLVPNQGGYLEGVSSDFTTTLSGDSKTITVTPVGASAIATNGGTLRFTYRFVSDRYYDAIRLDSQAAVEARFGPAFNEAGIVTPLTAAAGLAFENGASSIIVQALFRDSGSGVPGPVDDTQVATPSSWAFTLLSLRDIEDANIIVPIIGQSDANVTDNNIDDIHFTIQDHLNYMKTQGQYIITVLGEDSSQAITEGTVGTLQTHAGVLRGRYGGDMAEQTVMVSPTRFKRTLPNSSSTTILVGGQYMAAAVAGMIAARPTVQPLTRKQVAGFNEVSYAHYDKAAKDADANAGLLVVEQKGTVVQVRHGITLDNTNSARRELSVVRAKHRMIESIRQTIDTQIIGNVPADGNAPMTVKNAVIGVLEELRGRRELIDYTAVEARILTGDPTTVEVRFSYQPAFPLNYVNVTFSLDLNGGAVTTTFGVAG